MCPRPTYPPLALSSRYIRKCTARFLKRSDLAFSHPGFSLVTTLSRFWVSQGKESLCAKQKSSRISLINSSWPELWKINTSMRSEFIFHKSGHSEFIYHLSYRSFVCTRGLFLIIFRYVFGRVYLKFGLSTEFDIKLLRIFSERLRENYFRTNQ